MVIRRPVVLRDGDREASLSPCDRLRIDCAIDFDHPLVPGQALSIDFSSDSFTRELARARTFGFLKDVERLKSAGLARGGSLENAIVVDEFSILNPEGLRYPGRVRAPQDRWTRSETWRSSAIRSSGTSGVRQERATRSTTSWCSRVLADASSFAIVRARRRELERLDVRMPDFALALESISSSGSRSGASGKSRSAVPGFRLAPQCPLLERCASP